MSPTIRYKSILALVSVTSLVLTAPTFAGLTPTPTATPSVTPAPTTTVTPSVTPVPTTTATPTGTPTATPTPVPSPLTKDQRKCVNEMNKSGLRVNKAQLKENEWCLNNYQSEKLDPPATFDQCLTQDRRGKVQKAKAKTEAGEAEKCDPLNPPPAFAYTDAATVNAAAIDAGLGINYVIFGGPPVSDSDLFTKAESRLTAKCQLEMLKRADRLESAVFTQIYKAKKKALRDESVDSKVALEAKLGSVLSSNSKINKAEERLVNGVHKRCDFLGRPTGKIFPGSCGAGNPSLSEVEDCVIAAARCEACLKINAFDDLDLDCDQADNQLLDSSCQ